MAAQASKLYSNDYFAIWHIPDANGYVYEAAGVAIDGSNYHDSPFEDTYEEALEAACELYDFDPATMVNTLAAVYANALFEVYRTPGDDYLYRFLADADEALTDRNIDEFEGERYPSREAAIIAAFEEDLAARSA